MEQLNIYIKKRPLQRWLILYVLLMPFVLPTLLQWLGLSRIINYTIDVVILVLFLVICGRSRIEKPRNIIPFVVFIGLFFTYSLVVYLFNYQSLFYFLWGVRNNFRFYIAFLACVLFLEAEDVESFFRFLDILFWLNFVVTLVQFFLLDYNQDFLGGIFGVERGANAGTLVFYVFVLMRSILLFFEGEEKYWLCFMKCAVACLVAAMAELKVFYLFFVFILILSMILTRASWKKGALLIVVSLFFIVSNLILVTLFQSDLFWENILKLITAKSYSSQQDLGRFSAIPTISETILTDTTSQLFGLGLGNCDTSSFSVCNTPFFEIHQNLHYTWFSSAFLFLETGYVGMILYFAFYVLCIVGAIKMFVRKEGNRLYQQMGIIMAFVCFILVFYNASLRSEIGYVVFFALSLPFVAPKSNEIVCRKGII